MSLFKRRRAVERWKATHREHYLAQKRRLASRPEYLAHRRAAHASKQADLREVGILPRSKGRPRLFEGAEDYPPGSSQDPSGMVFPILEYHHN